MRVGSKFTATYRGVTARFVVVEHVNVGEGWLCRELDGKLRPGVYPTTEMTDIEPEKPQ